MDKAAEKCAQYIYDMYGENGDGNTLWMRYMNGNNSWGCLVAKTGSEPERDNFLFSVFIDAGNGQRNNILDMRDTDSNLPKKSITDFEVAERNKKAPADLEKYEKLALEVARKHFYDSKVVSVNYHSMGIASSSGGAVTFVSYSGRVYEYKETLLSFVATDTKGRESEIIFPQGSGVIAAAFDGTGTAGCRADVFFFYEFVRLGRIRCFSVNNRRRRKCVQLHCLPLFPCKRPG